MQFDEFYRTFLRRLKVNLIDCDACGRADMNRGHANQRRDEPQSKRRCVNSPKNQAEGNHRQLNCWYLVQSASVPPATRKAARGFLAKNKSAARELDGGRALPNPLLLTS